MIVFAGIVPHPPLIIPSVGKDKEKKVLKTKEAYDRLVDKLYESEPDVIIIISPHMVHYPHLFNICGMPDLYGSFKHFGDENFEWHGNNDVELAEEIADKSEDEGLPAILYDNGEGEYEVDHGVMVPMFFVNQKLDFGHKVLPIGYSVASRGEHYTFGQVISEVCERRRDLRIAILASGDMSHRLDQTGKKSQFDDFILDSLKKGDEYSIINVDEKLLEDAGECAYRSILILLGIVSNTNYEPEIYSYEGPFGVGYTVVNMNVKEA